MSKIGVVWLEDDAEVDPAFVNYVEEILNCVCCQNNYDDPDHRHNGYCSPDMNNWAEATGHEE